MAEWSRTAATTLRDYIEGSEPTLLRNIKFPAVLESRGNVEVNCSGDGVDWAMEWQRAPVRAGAAGPLSYDPTDRFIRAYLDIRSYAATDSMGKVEFLKNRNRPALIKYYAQLAPRLIEDIKRQWGGVEIYVDGEGSGNGDRIHGFGSFLRFDVTTTVNVSTGALRSYNAADYVFNPSGAYGGVDMDLGAYGGAWNGVWPDQGEGSDTYDFASPVGVNYKSTSFGGSTASWLDQCVDACGFIVTALDKDATAEGKPDLGLLDRRMYHQLKTKLRAKERILVEGKLMQSLGFGDSVDIDGCNFTSDFGVPANKGIVLNCNHVTIRSYQAKLFNPDGPYWERAAREYRTEVDFFGNMFVDSPKYFGMLLDNS